MTAAMAMPWSALRGADVSEQTDDDLVRMAKKHGDAETFSELVRRHEHTVYNLAYRFMRDPDLAEDMAQEAF
ncbi:MAG TPA: hypothetical protein ENN80_08315, partial [Candidatus Hydrogenedentes bacterium]|nr:hypothetical protein [Candidatus Hydrogenedentota bacterium]